VEGEAYAMRLARQCRHRPAEPLAVQVDLSGAGFDKQLKRARRSGARWALLLGDEEAATGTVRLMSLAARPAEVGAGQTDRHMSETAFLALSLDQINA
jgi:histidyl-tRNA synthetase